MAGKALLTGAALTIVAATGVLAGCTAWSSAPPGSNLQGWNGQERHAWYYGDQGSRLMPFKWFVALEQPAADGGAGPGQVHKFLDGNYLARFRVLPPEPGQMLPIGFALDAIDDGGLVKTNLHWTGDTGGKVDWVGLNCAACHTGQVNYKGKTLTIDGAPSLFDYQSFVEAVDAALTETSASAQPGADASRWRRFTLAVLGKSADTPANRDSLLAQLNRLIDWQAQAKALNQTDLRYGFGRVDAIGHIYNRILLYGGAPQPVPNPADAPVSYPHLWNISKQHQLQWDGIVENAKIDIGQTPTDYGALGRNAGEVLGVFGEAVIQGQGGLAGLKSSINLGSLNSMEVLVTKLQSPTWPAAFGTPGDVDIRDASGKRLTPDQVVKNGGDLFVGQGCAECHTPHQTYEKMVTFADMKSDITDEWMACNAWALTGASGALANIPADYISGTPPGANAPVRALLTTTVKGALIGQKQELVAAALANIFGVTPLPVVVKPKFALAPGVQPPTAKQLRLALCRRNASNALLAYKARPLEGIWATAPYLHNGSVPTLYDLLLPPDQRPAKFAMGTRAYDPVKAGYDVSPGAPGNGFTFDTTRDGNSNKGHVYGVGALTTDQRRELLEYLKTL